MKLKTLETKLKEIFRLNGISQFDPSNLTISVQADGISYDSLTRLSKLVKTTNISTEYYDREHGGCNTCGWGDTPAYVEIYCKDINIEVAS